MANDTQSLQTASKKIRHLGSAKSGVGHARAMHLTSLGLMPLTIAFVWILLTLVGKDYATVRGELGHIVPALIVLLFTGISIYHMQLGMRTIIEDYIHGRFAKEWSLTANAFFCVAANIVCVFAILKVAFSAA